MQTQKTTEIKETVQLLPSGSRTLVAMETFFHMAIHSIHSFIQSTD